MKSPQESFFIIFYIL